ncbi:MAG: hypothetical protein RIQ52_477 [Pseudomonadota bacterium]
MKKAVASLLELLAAYGLDKLERALMFGAGLLLLLAWLSGSVQMSHNWFAFVFRWLHVASGIMWIGLLYYFNFVQIPSMAKIPDEQKPAVGKVIAPTALFWFRWASLATVVTGLVLGLMNGYLFEALLLGYFKGGVSTYIGIGMWLALLMAFNVWNIIWPNQQIALGMVEADADAKKAAARLAMLASRFNTALSIPMLYFMVAAQNIA